MDSLITVEKIIDWLTVQVEGKNPIDPATWLECASRINVLLQAEQEKLFELEQVVATKRADYLKSGETVAFAKTMIEATDEYRETKIQKAKIDRALEVIRLAKLNSRIARDLMSNQLQ